MYRMLIVDDERVIRETISRQIDWASLDVQIIGTASNGLDAYDMIMDESPDIVMTDIRMPGFSGLDLLQRIKSLHPDIEFIILSGYGEFEYAQQAMQWGVRHYLLKPCSKDKIITSVQSVIHEISRHRTAEPRDISGTMQVLSDSVILNLLNECIAKGEGNYEEIYATYRKYIDFAHTPYELCSLYFLDPVSLSDALAQIRTFREKFTPGIPFYIVYVQQCMLIFFRSYHLQYETLDTYMSSLRFPLQTISVEYKRVRYSTLTSLMDYVNSHVSRFATVQYSNGDNLVDICNYRNIIRDAERLTRHAFGSNPAAYEAAAGEASDRRASLEQLCELVSRVSNTTFLKQLCSTIIMLISSGCYDFSAFEAAQFLMQINRLDSNDEVLKKLVPQLHSVYDRIAAKAAPQLLSDRVKSYVVQHLADDELSLRYIADHYLYMNVDYVRRKFQKETGQKFSAYLTDLRIRQAMKFLKAADKDTVQQIAERVGFGNNPQYFSHVFKKATGMTPSAYIKSSAEGGELS